MSDYESGSGSNIKSAVLIGAVVALLAANVYLFLQLDAVRTDVSKLKENTAAELTNLREATTVTTANSRRTIDSLKGDLDQTRRQALGAANSAKAEALGAIDKTAQRLSSESKLATEQVATQVAEVKQQATQANTQIASVSGEVSQVKNQVSSTKAELEKTIADLKRVTGDLGVQSGLIATNGKELGALRRLGERNYFEFNLAKAKTPQKIGDITMLLKKTDQKRNKFTIELYADDKKVEKKDKNVNEPVQFYVAKARQPYELVVNEVRKDVIVGYLSVPKDLIPRAAAN